MPAHRRTPQEDWEAYETESPDAPDDFEDFSEEEPPDDWPTAHDPESDGEQSDNEEEDGLTRLLILR